MRTPIFKVILITTSVFLTACKQPEFISLSSAAGGVFTKFNSNIMGSNKVITGAMLKIDEVVDESAAKVNMNGDFMAIVKAAVEVDPLVLSAKANYEARSATIGVTKSLKDFQFFGTVYGGVEDITDETAGIAAVLNANKLIYDGGKLDSRISADEHYAAASLQEYELVLDESAFLALKAWVELDRYNTLSQLIKARLEVLSPLIAQLERVAEAGLGDAAMVSAAQRTVSMIEVTQTDVEQRLAQAEVGFLNVFGSLPSSARFDSVAISSAVPSIVSNDLIIGSPALGAEYAKYQAAIAALKSTRASDSINVGFETKIQRPFGESEYDSDESLGLVLRKTLYDGGKLNSEIKAAEAQVDAQLESFKSTFRVGFRAVKTARTTIKAMEKGIDLAKSNATNTLDEVAFLRKQLVIGQSTLDSVLSAEARLYDAESKEINFMADKHLAELTILSATGLLSDLLSLD